jgi:peptidoglycan/xylan/chitin deacetylase (PgdA/CDA1 family)
MPRYFSFRFDVDTHRCLALGVPELLKLGARLDVRFTFFVNMGRAVSRPQFVGKLLRARGGGRNGRRVYRLSSMQKLGLRDYLTAAVLNPKVGSSYGCVLRETEARGHEIGLHGGRNHAGWQSSGRFWSRSKLESEVAWGLAALDAACLSRPVGFASPGWQGSIELVSVLEEYGFHYVADAHGVGLERVGPWGRNRSLIEVSTGILGEPGGVGYLEYMRARGHSDGEVLADFAARLDATRDFAVVYDHPFYAGLRELATIEAMVGAARERGFEVVPLRELAAVWPEHLHEDDLLVPRLGSGTLHREPTGAAGGTRGAGR